MLGEAYRNGIRYFDSAPVYAGSERYQGSLWKRHADWKAESYQASKSAQRDYAGAMADLRRTLERLNRNDLDLWQIHDVQTREDIREIEGKEGALRVFTEARGTGLVRGIGVTGHHDPEILHYAVTHWPVDTVLLPINPVEADIGGFLDRTVQAAKD
jgi:aryl-alcohol dehydrogenase-like predicted oxidoreductase